MNAILVSVPPEVCERIANGEQAVLLMKRLPKMDAPYKVHMYCTKPPKSELFHHGGIYEYAHELIRLQDGRIVYDYGMRLACEDGDYSRDNFLCQKVIGEFVCNTVRDYASDECPDYNVLDTYGAPCYGLRITDLKIYDTPKELGEFKHCCKHNRECDDCKYWGFQHVKKGGVELLCPIDIPLTRPPTTFCYIEELCE